VELTAPYMHDGAFDTLEEVVRFYDKGAQPRHAAVSDALVDPLVRTPLLLTNEEIQAIVEFIRHSPTPARG
jgi:cytochrome c peroxidase